MCSLNRSNYNSSRGRKISICHLWLPIDFDTISFRSSDQKMRTITGGGTLLAVAVDRVLHGGRMTCITSMTLPENPLVLTVLNDRMNLLFEV